LYNNYRYTYEDPIQACNSIIDWCSKGIQYISFINRAKRVSDEREQYLDDWKYAFKQLETQVKQFLGSGHTPFYNPAALNKLLHQGDYLNYEFNRFLQTQPLPFNGPVKNNQQTIEFPVNEITEVETNLRNEKDQNSPINPIPIGGHTLPPLPYDYNALEPYIDEKTMHLHHDKHHKSYVDGLNKAEIMMEKARKNGDFELIKHWEREAAFNGAGHYLHTIFWNNMIPHGRGELKRSLNSEITKDFGTFLGFKKHFSAAAEKAEAVGWAILVWSPRAHRMEILQAEKHQNLSQWDVIPLLVLDVWEHAVFVNIFLSQSDHNRSEPLSFLGFTVLG
jgi:superoxide dismutase